MDKSMLIATVLLAGGLACNGAQAGDVYWSVGINAPLDGVGTIGTVIGNYPRQTAVIVPAPVYPAYPGYPVVYEPRYQAPPVVFYPQQVQVAYPYAARSHWHREAHEMRGRDHSRFDRREAWRGRAERDD